MYKQKFHNLLEILDELIRNYTDLMELFSEKREILKKAKPDELGVIDDRIIALNNGIMKTNKAKQKLSEEILGKDGNMSDFIEFAKENAPEFVDALSERKVKICNIIPKITLLNEQNVELLKHGIIISNKMLETVIDAFAPQGSYYNGDGKTDTHDVDMWTISEEI